MCASHVFQAPRLEARDSFDAAFGLILSAAFLPRCSFHPIFLVRFPRLLSCVLPGTLQAMQYFWRVLDVYGEGRLTVATISLFFRDVARALKEGGFETPNTEDVKVQVVATLCLLSFFSSCLWYRLSFLALLSALNEALDQDQRIKGVATLQ